MDKSKFYSNQPRYIKFWRDRFLLLIPFYTLSSFVMRRMTFKQCLTYARGLVNVKRQHLITWEDMKIKRGLK